MRINANPSYGANFSAIDRKYLKWAQNDYVNRGGIDINWMHQFGDDVCLFKTIPQKDVLNTLAIAKEYISKGSKKVFDDYINEFIDYCKNIKT